MLSRGRASCSALELRFSDCRFGKRRPKSAGRLERPQEDSSRCLTLWFVWARWIECILLDERLRVCM